MRVDPATSPSLLALKPSSGQDRSRPATGARADHRATAAAAPHAGVRTDAAGAAAVAGIVEYESWMQIYGVHAVTR